MRALVDTFTAAGTITSLWLSLTIRGAAQTLDAWYARALIATGTAASLAINIAHAPDGWAPRLVAGIPPVALLLAVELLLSLARRTLDAQLERTAHDSARHHVPDPRIDVREDTGRTSAAPPAAQAPIVHTAPHTAGMPPSDPPRTSVRPPPLHPPARDPATVSLIGRSVTRSVRAQVEAVVVEREVHGSERVATADLAAELDANLGTVRNALRAARRAHGLTPQRAQTTPHHAPRPGPHGS